MHIKILKPGLLTTVQDTGRFGHRQEGIILSGAMDGLALRIANLLVGNLEDEAALEITLIGPKILFEADCLVALTGADLSPCINNIPVKLWRPIFVSAGSVLAFGKPRVGCRSYLAFAGGLNIPKILDSYATYLRAGFGGLQGQALQTDDCISINKPPLKIQSLLSALRKKSALNGFAEANWTLNASFYPTLLPNPIVRGIKGPEFEWFTPESQKAFWEEIFQVTPQSDRMGYGLQGPELLRHNQKELLSTAVSFGTVQVPNNGNPMLLMADHQTTGGYPRLAQIISADFSVLAQVKPGEAIRFKEISLPKAQKLFLHQERNMERLKNTLSLKFKYYNEPLYR